MQFSEICILYDIQIFCHKSDKITLLLLSLSLSLSLTRYILNAKIHQIHTLVSQMKSKEREEHSHSKINLLFHYVH